MVPEELERGILRDPYFVDVDNVIGGRQATDHLLPMLLGTH